MDSATSARIATKLNAESPVLSYSEAKALKTAEHVLKMWTPSPDVQAALEESDIMVLLRLIAEALITATTEVSSATTVSVTNELITLTNLLEQDGADDQIHVYALRERKRVELMLSRLERVSQTLMGASTLVNAIMPSAPEGTQKELDILQGYLVAQEEVIRKTIENA